MEAREMLQVAFGEQTGEKHVLFSGFQSPEWCGLYCWWLRMSADKQNN